MKFIISAILTLVFAYFLRNSIKKHAKYYYLGALAITLFTIFANTSGMPAIVGTISSYFFKYGTVGTAMISLVMYTNAFKNGSIVQKTFMPIRAELSIIACILIYGHNLSTGKTYVTMFFAYPERMSTGTIVALFVTLILMLMMTPLFITSFKPIRKKMKAKNWKKLQRLAYPYYMLIYAHIMFLMIPYAVTGNFVYIIDVIVYSIVFLGYGTLRLHKYYKKSKNPVAIVLTVAMYVALALALVLNMVDFSSESVVEEPVAVASTDSTVAEDSDDIDADGDADTAADADHVEEAEEVADEPTSKYDIDLSVIPDGEYTGAGFGFNGDVTVTVTMVDGVIDYISLDSYTDDEEYMVNATWVRKYMMDEQTVDVDVVTGATYSSLGIKDAVLDALTLED